MHFQIELENLKMLRLSYTVSDKNVIVVAQPEHRIPFTLCEKFEMKLKT